MNLAEPMIAALRRGSEQALLFYTDPSGHIVARQRGTDVLTRAAAWSQCFTDAGLACGDSVALSPSRGPDLPCLHLAALAAGLTVVPLNAALTGPEIIAVLQASHVRLAVTAEAWAHRVGEAADEVGVPWWGESRVGEHGGASGQRLHAVRRSPSDPALVIYTSGTTGRPKSVPLSHANLNANVTTLARIWERSRDDRLLHMLPAHHYHGLVLALYGSLQLGADVVVLPAFDAELALAAIPRYRINLLMGVPTMYARMLAAARPQTTLSGVRLAISGSAPLDARLSDAFAERFGIRLVNRYGLTETGIVTSDPPAAPKPGAVGQPLPGTRIAIRIEEARYERPEAGKSTPLGEICIAGPSVTAGYGNDPEATAESIHDGYFHSGDLGYIDEDGYLHVEGRIKQLIIVGGSNVVPGEVESALADVDGVDELAVGGRPHEDLGEIVAAYIVADEAAAGDLAALEARLRATAEARLARYKRPRVYLFVEQLPRNAMGKIDHSRMRQIEPS